MRRTKQVVIDCKRITIHIWHITTRGKYWQVNDQINYLYCHWQDKKRSVFCCCSYDEIWVCWLNTSQVYQPDGWLDGGGLKQRTEPSQTRGDGEGYHRTRLLRLIIQPEGQLFPLTNHILNKLETSQDLSSRVSTTENSN